MTAAPVVGEAPERRTHVRMWLPDTAVVALFATVVSAAGAARPSLWFDEAATISASTRSLPELWGLLHNIDAVHGLYYFLMHGWFTVFPVTEFWSRLSSSIAIGGAAAGVVVLGRQFSGRAVAVCAGVMFAILPRITWAGLEARSYALSTLAVVWLTVLVVTAVREQRRRWWPLYACGVVVATVLNVFVVLIVPVHAVVVLALGRRAELIRWTVASAAAIVALAPFLLYCRTQIAQVRWIPPLSTDTVFEIVQRQYFDHSLAFALLSGLLLLVCVVCRRTLNVGAGERVLTLVAVSWIVAPTAGLLMYSALFKPVYYPRYLCYTAPALALMLAVCVVALARSREGVVALTAVMAIAATPNYLLAQRSAYAKEGMDYSQVADVISANSAPGDCLIMDNTVRWLPGPIRPMTAARPDAYAHLADPGRGASGPARNRLWDFHIAIWAVADQVRRCTVLWTVSERDPAVPDRQGGEALDPGPRLREAPAYRVPERLGFHVVERWQFNFAQVTKSTR
ncbi:glycosyltransferase family 39 protein [Mycolicibacterium sp. F2034L]|uniref:glycosyltransferase family 39 protein n=1 Tax=Mycolicibacterium sp. F2034L TaxID=2926422 RepID=UPI001FF36017|nr:glycosyltransferase family 39 protein [Mycolicibacterium sp. F2034L]MCK0173283.1 glycosyltransferase family 39 protein [Mycolicibacterium sp. F2034L]